MTLLLLLSQQASLPPRQRHGLRHGGFSSLRRRDFRGIGDLIDNSFDGRIVKGYLTTLYVAERK